MEKIKRKIFLVTFEFEGELIRDILKDKYSTAISKGSGMEIIDEIREVKPDIIILDYAVINLDPEEFLMILKGDEKTRMIPIFILYSDDMEKIRHNVDVESFIKRPVNKDGLIIALNNIGPVQSETNVEKMVLIVDDNSAVRKKVKEVIENHGYSTLEASSGLEVLNKVNMELPDLIILDIMLPDIDGFKILNQLKVNVRTKHIPVILLSSIEKEEEKVKGFLLDADDYITKPFSSQELGARVERLLERTEVEYSASPTTRLPGNIAIEKAITRRIMRKLPFTVCYCDLDNFKAYNDTYGFFKGDSVIRLTAQIIMASMKELGNTDDFIGHIGGDDFILITTPDKVDPITKKIIESFDKIVPFYYDKEAREKGYIEALDRQGRHNRFTIMSISIAVVSNTHREIRHIGEVSDIAAGLKKLAKMKPGSVVVKDERRSKNKATLN